jgi:PhzF family phenazine biosynthesis protein
MNNVIQSTFLTNNSANFWIVDAFTKVSFRGNPTAVYLLPEFPDNRRLQLLAARAGLAETAFVVKTAPLQFSIRWFTPTMEISSCSHATLAAAHVLIQVGEAKIGEVINFRNKKSITKAKITEAGIEFDLPALAGIAPLPDAATIALISEALGVEIIACEKNQDDFLVEVKDAEALLSIRPIMKKLGKIKAKGVIVTTNGDVVNFDFASRFFPTNSGIAEDPVTGSAHSFLAPYWAKKLNKNTLKSLQAATMRGFLEATLAGDRVLVTGNCITTLKGTINSLVSNNTARDFSNNKEIFA